MEAHRCRPTGTPQAKDFITIKMTPGEAEALVRHLERPQPSADVAADLAVYDLREILKKLPRGDMTPSH